MIQMIRKILMPLLCAVACGLQPLSAQKSSHMKFMNIPMSLPAVEYVCALQDLGLRVVESAPDAFRLQGTVAEIEGCHVIVLTDAARQSVTRTSVVFPEAASWSGLEHLYFQLKAALKRQYGEPTVSKERFKGLSRKAGDRARMEAVRTGRCRYHSDFVRKEGMIGLSIEGHPEGAFVFLLYVDGRNDARADAARKAAR